MMKARLLITAIAMALVTSSFAAPRDLNKASRVIDPFSVAKLVDASQLPAVDYSMTPAGKVVKKKVRKLEEASATSYFGVFESFFSGWTFSFDGGDILTYSVDITIDGTVATIGDLFNLEAAGNTMQEITGRYDAEAGTISIPTPTVFDEATIAGYAYGIYPLVLVAGEVTSDQKLAPVDELVFNVSSDLKTISTTENFGISMYAVDGSMSYGFNKVYKNGTLSIPADTPNVKAFTTAVDFGEIFPEYPITKTFNIINLSSAQADFSADCDGDGFTITPVSGTIDPLSVQTFTVTFNAPEAGDYEGIVTIETEDDPIMVGLSGVCVPTPDYSSIVTKGDLKLSTSWDFPFKISDSLIEGETVAMSSNTYDYGDSYLTVTFDVPEGKVGVLSWKGGMNIGTFYRVSAGLLADDVAIRDLTYTSGTLDLSGNYKFAPGKHTMKFDYNVVYYAYGTDTDYMWIYDLGLDFEDLLADKASLETESLNYGNFIYNNTACTSSKTVVLLNEGSNDLKVLSATADENFKVNIPDATASTMNRLSVTIDFEANAAGEYNKDITLTTSAGDFVVNCKALVREMPDFSQIVENGDFTFTTSADYPYEVRDGVAVNSTSKVEDTVSTTSWLQANFTIPEGKIGRLTWKSELSCTPIIIEGGSYYYYDGGILSLQKPMSGYTKMDYGESDLSSDGEVFTDDWTLYTPGECYIRVEYRQAGDSRYDGEDWLTLSNLNLVLDDFVDHSAELVTPEVEFEAIYQGKTASQTASLKNTGSMALEITNIQGDGPFSAEYPSANTAAFGNQLSFNVTFSPEDAGVYEGDVVISTNAGDFTVHCKGEAMSTADILLLEDFEDSAANWRILDIDGDGYCWDLAWNIFGGYPYPYVHGGKECLCSSTYYWYAGDLTPDNWTFSPSFEIPETGAILTWWVSSQSSYTPENVYDVYVAEGDLPSGFNQDNYTSIFNETLESAEWEQREVNLDEYKNKKVHLAFRHHDCTKTDLMKIDDVIVKIGTSGVGLVEANSKVVSVEYYSIDGMKISRPTNGLYIVKTNYNDGSSRSVKRFMK